MTLSGIPGPSAEQGRRRGRPPGPTVDRDQRRHELIEAAKRSIRQNGANASMDDIAAEAGITKPILYDHFGDKNGLARALTEQVAGEIRSRMAQTLSRATPPRQRTRDGVDAFLTFVEEEPRLYEYLARAARTGVNDRTQRQLVVTLASDIADQISAVMAGAGQDTRPSVPWSYAIIGQILIAAEWWLAAPQATSRDELADDLTRLIWDGLGGAGLPAN